MNTVLLRISLLACRCHSGLERAPACACVIAPHAITAHHITSHHITSHHIKTHT